MKVFLIKQTASYNDREDEVSIGISFAENPGLALKECETLPEIAKWKISDDGAVENNLKCGDFIIYKNSVKFTLNNDRHWEDLNYESWEAEELSGGKMIKLY